MKKRNEVQAFKMISPFHPLVQAYLSPSCRVKLSLQREANNDIQNLDINRVARYVDAIRSEEDFLDRKSK